AIGGALFAIRAEVVYATAIGLFGVALLAVARVRSQAAVRDVAEQVAPRLDDLVAGVRFVLRTRMLLGAIGLDLFAVLFGGAVASVFGTVTSVVAGGVATIGVALAWTGLFPSLARMGRLEDLRPEPVG